MKLTPIIFGCSTMLLAVVNFPEIYLGKLIYKSSDSFFIKYQVPENITNEVVKENNRNSKIMLDIEESFSQISNLMNQNTIPPYFKKVGISLFYNSLPIYLDERSIKQVGERSYVYTTFIGINNRKSETDYIVDCREINNVRLLRSRYYNNNQEITHIELVDKLVSADSQEPSDADKYNANRIVCF